MSKHGQLPPRFPSHTRGFPLPTVNSGSLPSRSSSNLCRVHKRSPSLSEIVEEQPSWFAELLDETEIGVSGANHRRSASDSIAFSEPDAALLRSNSLEESDRLLQTELGELAQGCRIYKYNPSGCDGDALLPSAFAKLRMRKQQEQGSALSTLVSDCIYGPNSPRLKPDFTVLEGQMSSDKYKSEIPFSYSTESIYSYASEVPHADARANSHGACDDLDPEVKGTKRNSGQRSRVRKLQYIAELERIVNAFQSLESMLAAKVESLLEQRVILTVENNALKQKMACLAKQKMVNEGQCHSLKSEIGRLKMASEIRAENRKFHTDIHRTQDGSPELTWQILDMSKVSLGGHQVPLTNSYRS